MKARPSPPLILVATTLLAIAASGCGPSLAVPPAAIGSPTPAATSPSSARPSRSPIATATTTPSPSPSEAHDPLGDPFTVLVLGLDHEARTDALIVVGIDPASRSIAMASIPRDTIDVPLPGGGVLRNQKINAFYNMASKDRAKYPQGPARATADMVGTMLGIRIDYTASTTFGGFSRLTDAMGGVTIDLPKAIVDPHYEVTTTDVGVRFPRGRQTLDGKRALIFVRTRYADNDFERQRRQQSFLLAAGRQLLGNPALLASLGAAASKNLSTDFPAQRLPGLIALIGSVDGWTIRTVVLGPRKYESSAQCPCGYALAPKLDAMRKLSADFFPWAVRR
ncbi:MAG TPA: LCP family protein [Candidatus Limnocylindrales bacterium]|nr:LCP family protein [Candidatus Limnocylindrales bacterium]